MANKKTPDYTALYAIDGIAPIAPGKRPPVPSTIKNSTKPQSQGKKSRVNRKKR